MTVVAQQQWPTVNVRGTCRRASQATGVPQNFEPLSSQFCTVPPKIFGSRSPSPAPRCALSAPSGCRSVPGGYILHSLISIISQHQIFFPVPVKGRQVRKHKCSTVSVGYRAVNFPLASELNLRKSAIYEILARTFRTI